MEPWRRALVVGLFPSLGGEALESLRDALAADDPRLAQGCTTTPPPLQAPEDWPVEAACLVAWCHWRGRPDVTVGETEEVFASWCHDMDQRLDEPAGCRWLLNFWDESRRSLAISSILPEVERELARRRGAPL